METRLKVSRNEQSIYQSEVRLQQSSLHGQAGLQPRRILSMKSISSMIGHPLRWVRPSIFKQVYELRDGEECIATLKFPKVFSRLARPECGEGCWTLEQQGIWKPRILVKECDSEDPVATMTQKHFSRVTKFTLPKWRTIRITANIWRSAYSMTTDMGEPLVSLKVKHFAKYAADVELDRKGESVPELPWLLFLLWYLVIINQRRAAAGG